MQYKIALDIDDVLANFYSSFCARYGQPCKVIDIWDGQPGGEAEFIAKNVHKVEMNSRFWLNLDKLSHPQDINFKIDCYITSSPARMNAARKEWLLANGFPQVPVISTVNKLGEMIRRNIDVLVDDNCRTLDTIKEHGFTPIQFVPPYMKIVREDLNPIRHLSEIPQLLINLRR